MSHPGYLRNFESAIAELTRRGHHLELVFDSLETGASSATSLLATLPEGANWRLAQGRSRNGWTQLGRLLRLSLDYLRYLEPPFERAEKLRSRAERSAPLPLTVLVGLPGARTPTARRLVSRALSACERSLPTDPHVDRLIEGLSLDAVLVTPLVGLGSHQPRYLRSARRAGIPSVLCVASWDNLTNKGLIHGSPDLVLVWNETQRAEAVDLHAVEPERVEVTGAHSYDHWFAWSPTASREEFCSRVGLRSEPPYVLYTCSSPFIAPNEVEFVRRWIARLREAGGRTATASVLVRPHPLSTDAWEELALDSGDRVAVWPPAGEDPVSAPAKSSYYDSMYHATAVVGLNTSALIEAAILGKPVLSPAADEFGVSQGATLHFAHLTEGSRPLLRPASFDEHVVELERALESSASERNASFLESFVRPLGLERPAAPALADAIESLAGRAVGAERQAGALRLALLPAAAVLGALDIAHGHLSRRRGERGEPGPQ